ncbi:MAG: hypothetical protein AAF660_08510 [Pseudomonadota bacterium]
MKDLERLSDSQHFHRKSIRKQISGFATGWCFAMVFAASGAMADSFQFEAGAELVFDEIELTTPLFLGFPVTPPPEPQPTITSTTDNDTTSLFARWYLDEVEVGSAPRSRAAFASRASFLSFGYQQLDVSSRLETTELNAVLPGPPPPAIVISPVEIEPFEAVLEGDEFAVGGRYVWKDSGWFVDGRLSVGSLDTSGGGDSDVDVTVIAVGGGLYLGDLTTVGITVLNSDVDSGSALSIAGESNGTDIAFDLQHLGRLTETWQYGFDAGVLLADEGDDQLSVSGSLYPTQDIAFGLRIVSATDDFLDDGSRYTLFGRWFVTPGFEVFASLGTSQNEEIPGVDIDNEFYGIGVTARF